ncbi:MAG: PAS domain S-box protein, partial [Candidatus Hydrothermae bacterium]|nr:PAS domain S-box protein [Candidatus Hydrothermae bacterium]
MKLPEVKKLQELINVSSEILLILDREGNIIYSNKSINLLGYTPEEVISKPFSRLVAGHQRLNIEKKLLTSAKKGKKIFYKILLRTKEAATLSGEINGVHNGENYFLSIKVIENENVPRDILDTLESGILLVDEDMKIIYHNPYVSHVFENRRYTHLKQLPYGIGQK